MTAMQQSENGTFYLLPYAMPRSLDEHGDGCDQGRYCIAYSRDGWFLLDTDEWAVLRWGASEEDVIKAREEILRAPVVRDPESWQAVADAGRKAK